MTGLLAHEQPQVQREQHPQQRGLVQAAQLAWRLAARDWHGGSGLLRYVLTGMVGSLVGGFLLERLGIDLGLRSRLANRIATATIGAMVVILAARLVA